MGEFDQMLAKVASGADFDLGRHGRLPSTAVRALYIQRQPNDYRWALAGGYCQVNRNPLFFDAKSIRANTTNQRLRWHVDQWNLQEIS